MENRYKILKELKETNLFNKLVSSGLISINTATRLMIYEKYLKELKNNKKSVAVQFTSDYYKVTLQHVYQVIVWME